MSNNAVKLYSSVDAEEKAQIGVTGIPDQWPQEVIPIGDSTNLPDQNYQLMTDAELTAHKVTYQSDYNAWLAIKNAPDYNAIIGIRIQKAMDFGKKLMVEYGTKNVLRGYTVSQVREVSVKLSELQNLLLSGSLYCAKQAAVDMTPDSLVTQEDKDELIAKINTYLGIS